MWSFNRLVTHVSLAGLCCPRRLCRVKLNFCSLTSSVPSAIHSCSGWTHVVWCPGHIYDGEPRLKRNLRIDANAHSLTPRLNNRKSITSLARRMTPSTLSAVFNEIRTNWFVYYFRFNYLMQRYFGIYELCISGFDVIWFDGGGDRRNLDNSITWK